MCDMYCYSAGYDVVSYHSFFFFKQKTAYEVRISDWSSDVCSSDLPASHLPATRHGLSTLPTNPASFSMRAFCSRRNSQDWGTISSCRAPTALRSCSATTSDRSSRRHWKPRTARAWRRKPSRPWPDPQFSSADAREGKEGFKPVEDGGSP